MEAQSAAPQLTATLPIPRSALATALDAALSAMSQERAAATDAADLLGVRLALALTLRSRAITHALNALAAAHPRTEPSASPTDVLRDVPGHLAAGLERAFADAAAGVPWTLASTVAWLRERVDVDPIAAAVEAARDPDLPRAVCLACDVVLRAAAYYTGAKPSRV